MAANRIWIYAVTLFLLVGTILTTQVMWILQAARIEESFLNQRVNMALCSAMDVLSTDRAICSNVSGCVSHGHGKFEIAFNARDKQRIDSVITHHLRFYNIFVPFKTTLSPYLAKGPDPLLSSSQALMFPQREGSQNVLVEIEIPSSEELIRAQVNGMFILSVVVLALLIWLFIRTLRGLVRERRIRTETVDFINTMAHDLKTPISNISFAVSMLHRESGDKPTATSQYISIIHDETTRLKERARKILGAASVDAVLHEASEKAEVDIHEIILQAVESLSLQLRNAGRDISMRLDATGSIVIGDPLQLTSTVLNIIDNAILYSKESSSIRVSTRNVDGGIRIEIEDDGPGIPLQEQELVFRKAYRVRKGNQLPEGFGLGLYIARTLVEKHGGRLSLFSDGFSGSCFVIHLPVLK